MQLGIGLRLSRRAVIAGFPDWANAGSEDSFDFDFENRRYWSGQQFGSWSGVLSAGKATFTRSTIGTNFDAAGALETTAINALRFNHDPADSNAPIGALIEPARENLVSYSDDLSNAYWSATGVSKAAGSITENSSNSQHNVTGLVALASAPSTVAIQAKFKAGSGTRNHGLRVAGASGSAYAVFSSSDGSVVATATTGSGWSAGSPAAAVLLADGYYLAKAVFTHSEVSGSLIPYMQMFSGTSIIYTGNGTSSMLIKNIQVEGAAASSSYFPTTSASATRAADALSIVLPTGTHDLTFTFDDDSTQAVAGQTGTYNVPTNLNRPNIKRVWGVLA